MLWWFVRMLMELNRFQSKTTILVLNSPQLDHTWSGDVTSSLGSPSKSSAQAAAFKMLR